MTTPNVWHILAKAPITQFTKTICVNEDEFMIAPYTLQVELSSHLQGLHKYNRKSNSWMILMKDPKRNLPRSIFAMNRKKTKLYLCQPYKSKSAKLHEITLNNNGNAPKCIASYDTDIIFGNNPSCIIINDTFHIVSGSKNINHYIWNENKCKLEMIGKNENWKQCARLIYIPSQNLLLSLGGYLYESQVIYRAEIHHLYNMTVKWEKMDIKLPIKMAQNGVVLTNDERFIIMFGGGLRSNSKEIFVLDLETWIFHKSLIKIPSGFYGSCCAQLMCNNKDKLDLIIYAYLRLIVEGGIHDNLIPIDIIELMMKWCSWNEIHLLHYNTGLHYKIDIDHILNSIS